MRYLYRCSQQTEHKQEQKRNSPWDIITKTLNITRKEKVSKALGKQRKTSHIIKETVRP